MFAWDGNIVDREIHGMKLISELQSVSPHVWLRGIHSGWSFMVSLKQPLNLGLIENSEKLSRERCVNRCFSYRRMNPSSVVLLGSRSVWWWLESLHGLEKSGVCSVFHHPGWAVWIHKVCLLSRDQITSNIWVRVDQCYCTATGGGNGFGHHVINFFLRWPAHTRVRFSPCQFWWNIPPFSVCIGSSLW